MLQCVSMFWINKLGYVVEFQFERRLLKISLILKVTLSGKNKGIEYLYKIENLGCSILTKIENWCWNGKIEFFVYCPKVSLDS